MTTDADPVFLDTNILIRANVAEAPYHSECLTAIKKLRAENRALWLSRQVLREYMVVLTRPQGFVNPHPAQVVAQRVRYFLSHFFTAEDSAQVMQSLLNLVETIPMGGKQIHDANIAASMLTYGVTHLLTLNTADFSRFSSHITILSLEDVQ